MGGGLCLTVSEGGMDREGRKEGRKEEGMN